MRTVKIIGLIVAVLGLLTAIVALLTEGIKFMREASPQSSQPPVAVATDSNSVPADSSPNVSNNPPVSFFNEWVNVDSQTKSITRVSIQAKDGGTYINMFGSCSPTDCDFRESAPNPTVNYNPETKTLYVEWVTSYSIMTHELTIEPDGRLKVVSHDHFTDNSGRLDFDSVDYFKIQ